MGQSLIDLVHITKSFDGDIVLDDLNLSVKENTFVTLLGPSGCGKTTTLRIIGGFEKADTGKVIFDGQDIGNIPPNKRQLNTVFPVSYTHLDVYKRQDRRFAERYTAKGPPNPSSISAINGIELVCDTLLTTHSKSVKLVKP